MTFLYCPKSPLKHFLNCHKLLDWIWSTRFLVYFSHNSYYQTSRHVCVLTNLVRFLQKTKQKTIRSRAALFIHLKKPTLRTGLFLDDPLRDQTPTHARVQEGTHAYTHTHTTFRDFQRADYIELTPNVSQSVRSTEQFRSRPPYVLPEHRHSHVSTRLQESHKLTWELARYAMSCINNVITRWRNSSALGRTYSHWRVLLWVFFFFFEHKSYWWPQYVLRIELGCNVDWPTPHPTPAQSLTQSALVDTDWGQRRLKTDLEGWRGKGRELGETGDGCPRMIWNSC